MSKDCVEGLMSKLTDLRHLTMPANEWKAYTESGDCVAYPDDPDDWRSESELSEDNIEAFYNEGDCC